MRSASVAVNLTSVRPHGSVVVRSGRGKPGPGISRAREAVPQGRPSHTACTAEFASNRARRLLSPCGVERSMAIQ
eukprot:6443842-Heterocapsa_arctica.AAC.1